MAIDGMPLLYEYFLFLAQVVTLVIAVMIVVGFIASLSMRQQGSSRGHLRVQKVNDRLRELRFALEGHVLTPKAAKQRQKDELKRDKKRVKLADKGTQKPVAEKSAAEGAAHPEGDDDLGARPRAFVLSFDGDTDASAVDFLRKEISAVLTLADTADEVIVCVESPGGVVHGYGLAASQLMRIRDQGIPLTVIVDKVAASGGYLMAAVANKICAAPFAILGSIGVVAQIPNVHRLLKKNDVDVEVLTAGKYKRTLTLLGENTEEGRQKFREELEDVHDLFKRFVVDNRPGLDLDTVATGEAWYGTRAIELNLVDELVTSDDYLARCCDVQDVYDVRWVEDKKPIERVLDKVSGVLSRMNRLLDLGEK
jgi:serine protease SohB